MKKIVGVSIGVSLLLIALILPQTVNIAQAILAIGDDCGVGSSAPCKGKKVGEVCNFSEGEVCVAQLDGNCSCPPVSNSTGVGWGNVSPDTISTLTGLGSTDPREMAANVINVILGFLGIIAVVLILIGGFMWMTAQGSEEKTGTAKKIMSAGVIGLVIVLAAFGIAKFVISALIGATQ